MILGFIEHLTIQWLLLNRPKSLSENRDVIFDMVMRAISKETATKTISMNCGSVNVTFQGE